MLSRPSESRRPIPSWRRYLRFWRPDVVADVDDELAFHFESRVEELVAAGVGADMARAQAADEFGDLSQVRSTLQAIDARVEHSRRRAAWWESLAQDARYALRTLVQSPALSLAAIATLALGVSISSVIVGAVHAVLLRPLPYAAPSQLVSLQEVDLERGQPMGAVSIANSIDYAKATRAFSGMASYALEGMNLTGAGAPERIMTERVTSSFFAVLGVLPERGRSFLSSEDREGQPHTVIISYELWQRLGADPALLGRTLRLDEEPYTVVGILPSGFQPPDQFGRRDRIAAYVPAAVPPDMLTDYARGDHEIDMVVRLRPGATLAQGQAEMTSISEDLARRLPETNGRVRTRLTPLRDQIVGSVRTSLQVLLGAVVLVFLVACVNLANLLLVRAVGRQREVAVRIALGASRARVTQTLVLYSALLAAAGCVAGLVVGTALDALLLRIAPTDIPRLDSLVPDWRVFALAGGLSFVAAVAVGLAPAWRVSRVAPSDALRASERSLAGSSVLRWRSALVVTELALSLILLTGSGLLVRSFLRLSGVDLGFSPDPVLALQIDLPRLRYPDAKSRLRFFEELERRTKALPGVEGVGFANRLPLRGGWSGGLQVELANGELRESETDMQAMGGSYLSALGVAVLRGRAFEAGDRSDAPRVAMVNAAFSREYFGGASPVGHRFRRHAKAPWITIVGEVADIRRGGKTAAVIPEIYFCARQTDTYPVQIADLAVRASGDPLALAPAIRQAVWSIDPDQPVTRVRTLADIVSESMARQRFEMALLVLFAAVALLLALVGIYGVVSFAVSQRTREFGIRSALGAKGIDILQLVLRQGLVLIGLGLAVGAAGGYALSRYLSSLLFGVEPNDPATFAAVGILLSAVAIAACWIPARRAASVDPALALRSE